MRASPELAIRMGRYMVETRNTLKNIAKEFGVSKATAHRYIRIILPNVNPELATQCKVIIEYHKAIAHLRGGEGNKIRHRKLKRSAQ